MNLIFLYKGLILGFSVAAPVGPIGILCINRTINKSYISGLITGLGAATADLIYGLIVGLGLTRISGFLISQTVWIQIIGLFFLFYLGVKTLIKKKREIEFDKSFQKGLFKDYLSTFILTITNPMTILFFIAVFAGLGLANTSHDKNNAILLVLGVFIGSAIWWLILSGLSYNVKKLISNKILLRIDLLSGIIIVIFGIYILIELINNLI